MELNIPTEAESGELRQEINTLRINVENVLKQPGKWVLIKGDEIIGYFGSFSNGLTEGYRRFGTENFLVQEVDALTRPPTVLSCGIRPATLAELSEPKK